MAANTYQKGGYSVYDTPQGTVYANGPKAGQLYEPIPSGGGNPGGTTGTGGTGTPTSTGNPIVDSGIRRYVNTGSTPSYSSAAADYFKNLQITPPDTTQQQQIKDQAVSDVRAQLDAIDASYATRLQTESIAATGRSGQGRSINARSGLLGSTMGEERAAGIDKVNKDAQDAILAERDAAKAAVLDKANQRAYDLIQAKTSQALTNAGNYLSYLKTQQDSARADVKTLAGSGIPLDQLSNDEYQQLFDQSGYGSSLVFDAIYNASLPQAQKKEYNYINAGNGVIVRIDPTGAEAPQSYDFSAPDGYEFKMAGDIPVFVNTKTQDVKVALPGGDTNAAAQYAKETKLDSYTDASGRRISVMYNPVSKTTRTVVEGNAQKGDGTGFPTGFKPQPFEVSAVSQFITAEGRKEGQTNAQIQEAITKAQSDSSFFYSILGTVVSDPTYSNLYYKPTTLGIPSSIVNYVTPTPAGQ